MDLPQEVDDYIRESIASSLGLPVSAKTLQLKILASEDERRRLEDHMFTLQDHLLAKERRIEQYKAEATMSARGLRKCVEEREVMAAEYASFVKHCEKLEREYVCYEQDIERLMESCAELVKENEELRERVEESFSITELVTEIQSLQKVKETRLRAEYEVSLLSEKNHLLNETLDFLSEENRLFSEENRRLSRKLKRDKHLQGSGSRTYSSGASTKGKRKSSVTEHGPTRPSIDFNDEDLRRSPLSNSTKWKNK